MKYQNYEKKFISKLEELACFKIFEEDTDMLIKIWRRHGGTKDCFVIGNLLSLDKLEDYSNFIYIQNGKYTRSFSDVSTDKYFLILQSRNRETAIGLPIYTIYICNP